MDLGISKVVSKGDDSHLTHVGMIVGTPDYISPEQARGEKGIDFRSDIYSLGATLYHLLTGQPPYDSETAMGIIACHLSNPIPEIHDHNKNISNESCELIHKMMQKVPSDRFDSWGEVKREIDHIIQLLSPKEHLNEKVTTMNQSNDSLFTRTLKWHRTFALLGLLLLFVITFSAVAKSSIQKVAQRNYEKACVLIKEDLLKNVHDIMFLLENARKNGSDETKKAAYKTLLTLQKEISVLKKIRKEKRDKLRIEKAIYILKREIDDSKNRNKALKLIEHYEKNGEYRDVPAIKRYIQEQRVLLKDGDF
jgi:hypothetical protein